MAEDALDIAAAVKRRHIALKDVPEKQRADVVRYLSGGLAERKLIEHMRSSKGSGQFSTARPVKIRTRVG